MAGFWGEKHRKMIKTLTATEAQIQIVDALNSFMEIANSYSRPVKLARTIENVGFVDLVVLYGRIKTHKKIFFLPGEIGNENICFLYEPTPGCTIMVESEHAIRVSSKFGINIEHYPEVHIGFKIKNGKNLINLN